MPADYISDVRLDGHPYTISMNHILRHRGIRLYQSSYDDDLRGSWLTLNCDPWGTPVTYAGYLLLALSLLWLMYRRRSAAVLAYLPVLIVVWWVFGARSSTLMPVLRSGWFVAHVSLVSAAYLLLLAMCLTSIVALCAGRRRQQPTQQSVQADSLPPQPAEAQADSLPPLAERLARTNRAMLLPAIALLAAGIFVGAIWANVSWGRYWGWDPKEVWALITLMVYAIPLHSHSLPSLRRPEVLHRYLAIAFLTVLATYFGVNLLLGGMHSYA
jgi:ABC-type transport system involved in cytochrome c biogenesis permease subunit